MQSFLSPVLTTIHLMLTLSLIGVVLLQKSEGGLGGLGGGMSGFMTSRGSTNLLTKTTRWLAAGFMVTSLSLAWLAAHSHVAPATFPTSQQPAPAPATPPAGQAPSSTGQSGAPAQPESAPSGQNGTTGTAPAAPAAPSAPTAPSSPAVPTNQ